LKEQPAFEPAEAATEEHRGAGGGGRAGDPVTSDVGAIAGLSSPHKPKHGWIQVTYCRGRPRGFTSQS